MESPTRKSQKFYDAVAEIFDREFYGPAADPCIAYDVDHIWGILRREIYACDRVLEVGSGTGYWIQRLRSEINADIYGIDFSEKMVALAKTKGCREIFIADAESLPFRSEIFDVVISPFDTLNHCPNYEKAFAEVNRVLKMGGKALLMVDNKDRLIPTYWNLSTDSVKSLGSDPRSGEEIWRHLVHGEEIGVYSHFFSKQEIKNLLKNFQITFLGIGIIPPLIPISLRYKAPTLCKVLITIIDPIERYLGVHWPDRAAHLLVLARKMS